MKAFAQQSRVGSTNRARWHPSQSGAVGGLQSRIAQKARPTFVGVAQENIHATDPTSDLESTEAAMRAAKERMERVQVQVNLPKPVLAEAEDIKDKFAKIQAEVSSYRALSAENGKLEDEVARLKQENAALAEQLAAQAEAGSRAVEAARAEAAEPLRLQLDELAMQLTNSQAQLERLGEAVESADQDKAAAVAALQEEKKELLLALAGAAYRLSDVVFPAGSLPSGLTIRTRVDGDVDLAAAADEAAAAQQQAQQQALTAAASAAAAAAAEAAAKAIAAVAPASGKREASSSAAVTEEGEAEARGSEAAAPRSGGWLGRLVGFVGYWLYQALGALLLYYAAAILRGQPPALTMEFGIGCVLVCTLLPVANRLLVRRGA